MTTRIDIDKLKAMMPEKMRRKLYPEEYEMIKQDTITLLTVGNIESQSIQDLEKRIRYIDEMRRALQTEREFVEYIIRDKSLRVK